MQAKFCTQINVGERSVGSNLDEMVAQCAEWHGKVRVVVLKFVKLWNVYQKIALYVFVLWGPDPFSTFIDDCVLVWVVVGGGARRGSEEVGKEVSFWEDRETKGAARRSGRGRRQDGGNRGNNDGRWEVLNRDVNEWDVLDYFLKALMGVCVLRLGVRVLKLRTREVVLLGSNISENFKEVGRSGDKDRRGRGDGDNGRRVDDEQGEESGWADRRVGEDGDGEVHGGVTIQARIVPGVMWAIEEVLNDLIGSGNIYLVDVVNLRPGGNRKGGGGDGGGGDGGDKRR